VKEWDETIWGEEQERDDVKKKRQEWLDQLPELRPDKLVFIDESSAKTNMTLLRGRTKGGRRLFACAPHGHWCTTTMISSIRINGETAAMEFEGALDGISFYEYVRHILAPSLKTNDIVVFDNLRVHYNSEALELIRKK